MPTSSSTQEMIKELKEVKGVFSQCEKSDLKTFSRELEQQAQLDLAIALQMSLEIDYVINKFMEHIHAYFLFDGFQYRCEEPEVAIDYARQQGHSCAYNLDMSGFHLGQLSMFRGRRFSESELMLFEHMLTFLVHPLRNAIQHKKTAMLAHSDSLTGALNRSTFDESLDREINLNQRHGQDLTLMVVDIDHFKKVNDTFGHAAGDQVIKSVADVIRDSIRTTDLLFRYGGEEFVVLLTNTECEMAYVIADRVLEAVRALDIEINEELLQLSVSIGMTCLNVQDTRDSVFHRADQAMYHAKSAGRDQIKVAEYAL